MGLGVRANDLTSDTTGDHLVLVIAQRIRNFGSQLQVSLDLSKICLHRILNFLKVLHITVDKTPHTHAHTQNKTKKLLIFQGMKTYK